MAAHTAEVALLDTNLVASGLDVRDVAFGTTTEVRTYGRPGRREFVLYLGEGRFMAAEVGGRFFNRAAPALTALFG